MQNPPTSKRFTFLDKVPETDLFLLAFLQDLCPHPAFLEVVPRRDPVSRLFQETQPETFTPWVDLNAEPWH